MNRLVGANFVRLIKDKIFWICMATMIGLAAFMLFTCYRNGQTTGTKVPIDGGFFIEMQFLGALIASFCSMFVGTEYNDGTIRNKIAVGHKRNAIYLSNFMTVSMAGIGMMLMYLIPFSVVGLLAFGVQTTDMRDIAFCLFFSVMVILAYASICTMLSMCIQNRTIVMNISILGFFILMFAAIYLFSSLGNDAAYPYMTELQRKMYLFLFDFLPSGQGFQLASMESNYNWLLPLYSLIISVISSAIGMIVFHKKDIK